MAVILNQTVNQAAIDDLKIKASVEIAKQQPPGSFMYKGYVSAFNEMVANPSDANYIMDILYSFEKTAPIINPIDEVIKAVKANLTKPDPNAFKSAIKSDILASINRAYNDVLASIKKEIQDVISYKMNLFGYSNIATKPKLKELYDKFDDISTSSLMVNRTEGMIGQALSEAEAANSVITTLIGKYTTKQEFEKNIQSIVQSSALSNKDIKTNYQYWLAYQIYIANKKQIKDDLKILNPIDKISRNEANAFKLKTPDSFDFNDIETLIPGSKAILYEFIQAHATKAGDNGFLELNINESTDGKILIPTIDWNFGGEKTEIYNSANSKLFSTSIIESVPSVNIAKTLISKTSSNNKKVLPYDDTNLASIFTTLNGPSFMDTISDAIENNKKIELFNVGTKNTISSADKATIDKVAEAFNIPNSLSPWSTEIEKALTSSQSVLIPEDIIIKGIATPVIDDGKIKLKFHVSIEVDKANVNKTDPDEFTTVQFVNPLHVTTQIDKYIAFDKTKLQQIEIMKEDIKDYSPGFKKINDDYLRNVLEISDKQNTQVTRNIMFDPNTSTLKAVYDDPNLNSYLKGKITSDLEVTSRVIKPEEQELIIKNKLQIFSSKEDRGTIFLSENVKNYLNNVLTLKDLDQNMKGPTSVTNFIFDLQNNNRISKVTWSKIIVTDKITGLHGLEFTFIPQIGSMFMDDKLVDGKPFKILVTLEPGDTLTKNLDDLNIDGVDIEELIEKIRGITNDDKLSEYIQNFILEKPKMLENIVDNLSPSQALELLSNKEALEAISKIPIDAITRVSDIYDKRKYAYFGVGLVAGLAGLASTSAAVSSFSTTKNLNKNGVKTRKKSWSKTISLITAITAVTTITTSVLMLLWFFIDKGGF